ncbi:hypothetical protein FRC00_003530, partial [Tulasnella sp. 408]
KGNLSARAAIEWRNLSNAERAVWIQKAELVKEEHARMHPDYKYRPGRNKVQPGNSSTSTAGAFLSARTRSHSQRATASAAVPVSPIKLETPCQNHRTKAELTDSTHSRPDSSTSASSQSRQSSQLADLDAFNVPMSIPPPPAHDSDYGPCPSMLPTVVATPMRFAAPTPTYSMVIPEVRTTCFVTPSHCDSGGSASYDPMPLPLDVHQTREPEPSATYTLVPQPLSLGSPPDRFSDSIAVALSTYEEATAHSESYSATLLLPTPHAERAGPCRTHITRKRSFPAPYQSVTSNGGSRSAGGCLRDPPRQRVRHPWENAPGLAGAPELQFTYDVSSQTGLSESSSIDPRLPRSFEGYLHTTALSVYEEAQQPSTQPYMTLISEQQRTSFNQHPCYYPEDVHLLQPVVPYPVGVSSSPSSSSSASVGAGSLPTTSSFGSSSPFRAPLPPPQLEPDAFLENAGINLQVQSDYTTQTYPTYSNTESHGPEMLFSMDTAVQPMDVALASVDDALEHAHSYASWTYLYAPQ